MHFFNTEGPIKPEIHYFIPPLERLDREGVLRLIDLQKYFVLHAPRQTGKTTCMLALMRELNDSGRYRALYVNIEPAQSLREDVSAAGRTILGSIGTSALVYLDDRNLQSLAHDTARGEGHGGDLIVRFLTDWSLRSDRPIVLLLDEVDSLIGDSLISLLRQLRSGYTNRPRAFPQSIILCGVRDIRDYRIHASSEKDVITGGSAFNVKAESLRLGDFSRTEVNRLLRQHVEETGQIFDDAVYDRIWDLSCGQPWLVNALAYEVTERMAENRDRSRRITGEMIEQAKERLILDRVTHIDQLGDKLQEPRVRRVIEPMIEGADALPEASQEDISYVVDLGLIRRGRAGFEIANPIYREVIPRYLTYVTQTGLESTQKTEWYVTREGRLDFPKLLTAFQQFFRENSEHWVERFQYREAGPQLLLQAFLQRVINGGGRVEREYGLGRRRTDLLIIWHWAGGVQRAVIELKVSDKPPDDKFLEEGLTQTAEYLDRVGLGEGHLVIFDRSARSWDEKIYRAERAWAGRRITIWGM